MVLFRWAQCRSAQPLLWDYASERLSEEMVEQVEQHLQKCASCHKELASLKRAQGLLSACRMQEEPAPRSDWNDLQQRLVADGLAHISPVSNRRSAGLSRRRDLNTTPSRAPWAMQLATSAAGGFAAVLVLAFGYNTLHLRNAPGTTTLADVKTTGASSAASVASAAPTSPPQVTPPADDAQSAQWTANVLAAMRSSSVDSDSTIGGSRQAKASPENTVLEPKPSALLNASVRRNERRLQSRIARAGNHASLPSEYFTVGKASANKTLVSLRGAASVRNRGGKSKARPADAAQIQVASRYALEHVQPVGTDSDESNGYVVGSVRPITRDDEGVY